MTRAAHLLPITLLFWCACDGQSSDLPISTVTVMPSRAAIDPGQTQQFSAEARDVDNHPVDNATFSWETSNPSVATVDQTGLVSGLNPGTVTISAVASGAIGSATLEVRGFDPTKPLLEVSKAGSGIGDVFSMPAGINCGMLCRASFDQGTVVTLQAQAANGASFAGWAGACGGTGTCTVNMTQNQNVEARFETGGGLTARVSVNFAGQGSGRVLSSPAGIDCFATPGGPSGTCSATFNQGTQVTFSATPDPGSAFENWMGGPCNGSLPCSISITGDFTLTASFRMGPAIRLEIAGSGRGTVTSDPAGLNCTTGTCVAQFPEGTQVTLRAIPDDDSTFAGWDTNNGACNGNPGSTCTVMVFNQGTRVTATFADWRLRVPFPPRIQALTQLGTTLIGAGADGKIVTSQDARSWVARAIPTFEDIQGMAASAAVVVAVGNNGAIITSGDGISWTVRNSGTPRDLHGVTYFGGTFVAAGEGGTILSSPDGITWTTRVSNTTEDLLSAAYGGGEFLVGGYAGALLASNDGVSWSPRNSATTQFITSLAHGGGRWVGTAGGGVIITSTDAMTWTRATSNTTAELESVSFGNGQFVIGVGRNAGEAGFFLTSNDGSGWTRRSHPEARNAIVAVAYLANIWIASGDDASLVASNDAATWEYRLSPSSYGPIGMFDNSSIYGFAYGDGKYVGVGSFGTIVTSADTREWTSVHAEPVLNFLTGITYAEGKFVVIGSEGKVLTSTDALTWERQVTNTNSYLASITYGGSTFVAVGQRYDGMGLVDEIMSSPDGISWTVRDSGLNEILSAVIYGPNQFVAVGANGVVATSPDGIVWTPRNVGTNSRLEGIAYGQGKFVASGGGSVFISTDARAWTQHPVGIGQFGPITFGDNRFVGVSNGIWTSNDGMSWTFELAVGPQLQGVTYGPLGFVAGGIFKNIATHP